MGCGAGLACGANNAAEEEKRAASSGSDAAATVLSAHPATPAHLRDVVPPPAAPGAELWLRTAEGLLLVANVTELADGQPVRVVKRFGTIASGPVRAVFDGPGNLWLGDPAGHLVRYPKTLFANAGDPSLPAPDPTAMDSGDLGFLPCWLDQRGDIWAGRFERYAVRIPSDRLDVSADELRTSSPLYDLRVDAPGLWALGFDADNRIYAAVRTWLQRFSDDDAPNSAGVRVASAGAVLSPAGPAYASFQVEFDAAGNLWAVQAGHLMRVSRQALAGDANDTVASTVVTLVDVAMNQALGGGSQLSLDARGNLWLSSDLPYVLEFDAASLAAIGAIDGPVALASSLKVSLPPDVDSRILQAWVR